MVNLNADIRLQEEDSKVALICILFPDRRSRYCCHKLTNEHDNVKQEDQYDHEKLAFLTLRKLSISVKPTATPTSFGD